MADMKYVLKDMLKQRVVQAVTAVLAVAGLAAWVLGQWWGEYLAAAAIILFTVATIHWLDDEEGVEKEHLAERSVKK